jgi:hypothetical protein
LCLFGCFLLFFVVASLGEGGLRLVVRLWEKLVSEEEEEGGCFRLEVSKNKFLWVGFYACVC